jgi:cyclo(L-tyrosyl-L-tyrosyl) synthase
MLKEFLVIGMSPGNGYFKQEVVNKLLAYCVSHYEKTGIFIPDIPAAATYEALGYDKDKALTKKAIPQGNNFRNRVAKGIEDQSLNQERLIVFDWRADEVETNTDYQKAYEYLQNLYSSNPEFKKDIDSATESVLVDNPFKKKEITQEDIQTGTHYILSEFAFMLFLPSWVKDYEKFVYGYHNPWPVWEKFIAGEYDSTPKENLKFLLLPDFSN